MTIEISHFKEQKGKMNEEKWEAPQSPLGHC